MSTAQLGPVIQLIHQATAPPDPGDAELLARFARHGDASAFALLLERHAPTVLGVCRRVLHDRHEAEDVFQATFLLLVRKAGSLTRPGSLGPWLHGVAYRTALKARSGAARRRTQELREHDRITADPTDELAWRDLRPLLDEAIHGLPQKYLVPFVLCYLEGKSNAQAAEQLGCPRGTIATRLSRARDRLRIHLTRRGLTLPAAALAAVLPHAANARETAALALLRSARALATGGAPSTTSAAALALTKGVALAMFMERLKSILAVLLLVGAAGAGSWLLGHKALAGPPALVPPTVTAPTPRDEDDPADRPGKYRTANFIVEAPTGRVARLIGAAAERHRKRLAQFWLGKELPRWPKPCPIKVTISTGGTGAATSFAFDKGKVLSQEMHQEGSLDSVLATSLPHEVTHTILAHHFGRPVPRWADEGAAMMAEDAGEHRRNAKLLAELIAGGRAIPLRRLLPMMGYPPDVMTLYAQGYSLTRFLVAARDRKTFLAFVADGLADGWDSAVKVHYGYASVDKLERAWLASLGVPVAVAPPVLPAPPIPPAVPSGGLLGVVRACQKGRQIIFRTSVTAYQYQQVMQKRPGEKEERAVYVAIPVTRYRDLFYNVKDVQVFAADGKKVSGVTAARLLAKERPVLVSTDRIDPLYFQLLKEDALVLVLSPQGPPQPPPAFAPIPPTVPAAPVAPRD